MSVSCAFSFGCCANSDVLLFILPYNISYCLKMPVGRFPNETQKGRSRSRDHTQNLFCHSQEKRELTRLPVMAPRTLTPSFPTVPLFEQTKQTHNLRGSKSGKIPFSSTPQALATNSDWHISSENFLVTVM